MSSYVKLGRSSFNGNCYSLTESPYSKIHKRAVIHDTLNIGEAARLNCLNELLKGTNVKEIDKVTWLKVSFNYCYRLFVFSRNNASVIFTYIFRTENHISSIPAIELYFRIQV